MKAPSTFSGLELLRKLIVGAILTLGVLVIVGTGGDGDGSITVRNFDDDHSYWVGLFDAGQQDLTNTIQSTILDDYNPVDGTASDTFENVDEGDYFIIFRFDNVDGQERNRTGNFRLDDGEWECFSINEDGELHDCG